MKFRIFAAIVASMLLLLGFSATNVYANENENQYGYENEERIPSAAQIQQTLTNMLPDFENVYGYDLVTDLNRSGFSLYDFSSQLHNYLNFLYEAGIFDHMEFSTYGPNWLFHFLDGIVMEMSIAPSTMWGNVSLKGLVLNNIYIQALGLDLLMAFFSHHSIAFLAENLDVAAYFDFLMRDSSIAAVIPFGASARAYLTYGEDSGLAAVIGVENVAALGAMGHDMRLDFLAGLLMDRMATDLDAVVEEYANFIVIPAPAAIVPVNISRDEYVHVLTFDQDTAFEINADIGDETLLLAVNNTGDNDIFVAVQTYDVYGNWHIFFSDTVPAGLGIAQVMVPDVDLGNFIRVIVFSVYGRMISGGLDISIY